MDDQVDRTLYVGNLSENVTEEVLFELFLQAGPLVNVVIKKQNQNAYTKFSFVIFKHAQSVPYAIELFRDTKLFGKPLSIRARMESKHANADNDTTDSTPIDLQHKVLEFITHNPDVISDLQLPDPEPPRRNTNRGYSNYDEEDSYDPMSNYSVGFSQNYKETQRAALRGGGGGGSNVVTIDDDEYDPSAPSIQEQRMMNSFGRNVTGHNIGNERKSGGSQLGHPSLSSNMQSRLGTMNKNNWNSQSPRESRGIFSGDSRKRKFEEEDMMPYDKRRSFESDGGANQRQSRSMRSYATLQNPYELENTYRQTEMEQVRYNRSNSYDSFGKNRQRNAYGRR